MSKNILDLAGHIVESKAGHFDPKEFDDRYESALKNLIRQKQLAKPIDRPKVQSGRSRPAPRPRSVRRPIRKKVG